MLDIDNFKRYNDHYGHQAGDDALRSVALAIDLVVSQTVADGRLAGAFAARYGGEEFAVVVPDASVQALDALAQAVVRAVADLAMAHVKNEAWGIVTLSAGGAQVDAASGEMVTLFRQADARLYQAKQRGRNQAVTQG
jgi:diguanylate cyclase (GGDEF)-like protein